MDLSNRDPASGTRNLWRTQRNASWRYSHHSAGRGVGDVTKLYRCQDAAVVKERPVKSSEQSPRRVFKKAISKVEAYRLLGRCPEDFSPASLFGPIVGSECGSSPSTDAKPKDSSRCSLLTQAQVKASFSYQSHHICPNPSSNTYC